MLKEESLTPREIVELLDKYIIGQTNAKKSVAIALRNRWRRKHVPEDLRDEIAPKNILMIGPTGVGKTEIARRLAKLADAPFVKIEASKFTEVGYVGRDVDSIIRDLVEIAVNKEREKEKETVLEKARYRAEEKLLDILVPPVESFDEGLPEDTAKEEKSNIKTREKFRKMLREGKLDNRDIELTVNANMTPMVEVFSANGMEEMGFQMKDLFDNFLPKKKKQRTFKIKEAMDYIIQEEAAKMIDMDKVTSEALQKVQESGIVFLDEIDKIAGKEGSANGPDISREGVQRDLLPIIEGSTISTKYGMIHTDHILFIAAGAFHVSKPSDLIPELQGRFPIRVELSSLSKDDFYKILTEPQNALIKQYIELLKTESVKLIFKKDAIEEIASIAEEVNTKSENIGARRLHTIIEKLLEEVSFYAPEMKGQEVIINGKYVKDNLKEIATNEDLSKYIL